jgi:transporter family-2 protein
MVDKVGAGPLNGMIITANILASLVIDHYGLLHMPANPIGILRLVGGVLMVLGVFLIARF